MKRFIFTLVALSAFSLSAYAEVEGVKTHNVRLERNGDYMVVDMDIDISDIKVKSNRAVLVTPAIVNGDDSLNLASIGVYGRKRYYYYLREGRSALSGFSERSYRRSKRPDTVDYRSIIPYQEWMEGSHLVINRSLYGCCNQKLAGQRTVLVDNFATPSKDKVYYMPTFVYMKPYAEREKIREIKGSAYIDFPINKTEILPEYRNNKDELNKILQSINSVREDKDAIIVSLKIKGFASPEGTYAFNEYLAKERTAALVKYVSSLYNFDTSIIHTSFEAEDWVGLSARVAESNLEHKQAILDIIASDREPDCKERLIREGYPEQYAYIFKYIYPALRHSDYSVEYIVRHYSDINEIKSIMATSPQKLSLEELYLLANEYEQGSNEHHEVFEVAVRMFPNDEIANLNAANSAMQKRDFDSAKRYLKRAGKSAEATYARGAYAAMVEDYQTARELFKQAEAAGIAQAAVTLAEMDTFINKK